MAASKTRRLIKLFRNCQKGIDKKLGSIEVKLKHLFRRATAIIQENFPCSDKFTPFANNSKI